MKICRFINNNEKGFKRNAVLAMSEITDPKYYFDLSC